MRMTRKQPWISVEEVRHWYDVHAARFDHTTMIERATPDLNAEEQARLNRFQTSCLYEGGLISLKGKRVLEFGCGHGRLAIEVPEYESYLGVDVSANLVRMGNERLARAGLADRARLVVADCLAFEGPTEAFDVVCSLGMFAFVTDAAPVLAKMVSHLKPGGTLFIDGHYASPLYQSIRRWRWKRMVARGTYPPQRSFGGREIRILFAGAGLTDVRLVMLEYALLGMLYARRGWPQVLRLRDLLARYPVLNSFGTDFLAMGTKPKGGSPR